MKTNNDFDNHTVDILLPNHQTTETTTTAISPYTKGVIIAVIYNIFFGLSSFHMKLTKIQFSSEYDVTSFMIWRGVGMLIITLCHIKYTGENIYLPSMIANPKWFFVRTFGPFPNIGALILCISYWRVATAACMTSTTPALLLILAVLVLNEKFHMRYIYGIVICFSGTSLLVLNEDNPNSNASSKDNEDISNPISDSSSSSKLLIGLVFGIIHIVCNSMISLSQKILSVNNVSNNAICLYIAIWNILAGVIIAIFGGISISSNFSFILAAVINGFIFYMYCLCITEALRYIPLADMAIMFYISTVVVFLLGYFFLHEDIYYTDIIGCSIIMAFNVYNYFYPLQNE